MNEVELIASNNALINKYLKMHRKKQKFLITEQYYLNKIIELEEFYSINSSIFIDILYELDSYTNIEKHRKKYLLKISRYSKEKLKAKCLEIIRNIKEVEYICTDTTLLIMNNIIKYLDTRYPKINIYLLQLIISIQAYINKQIYI